MANISRSSENRPGLSLFGDDLDNIFEGFFRPVGWGRGGEEGQLMPSVDVIDKNDCYVVKAELPGVDKKDINVSINDGVLTISAERKMKDETKDSEGKVIRRESRYGSYLRNLQLDSSIDVKKVNAKYDNGILELNLPKLEQAKPKQIEIDVH